MSAIKRANRIAIWVLLNGFWYTAGILGTVLGLAWAWNIFVFITVLLFCLSSIALLALMACHWIDKPIKQEFKPAVPRGFDILFDLIMAIVVVGFGHWFVGLLVVLHVLEYTLFINDIQPAPEYPGAVTK